MWSFCPLTHALESGCAYQQGAPCENVLYGHHCSPSQALHLLQCHPSCPLVPDGLHTGSVAPVCWHLVTHCQIKFEIQRQCSILDLQIFNTQFQWTLHSFRIQCRSCRVWILESGSSGPMTCTQLVVGRLQVLSSTPHTPQALF